MCLIMGKYGTLQMHGYPGMYGNRAQIRISKWMAMVANQSSFWLVICTKLLGHATPCQWDNRHLATRHAMPVRKQTLGYNLLAAQFVEGRYNRATNYFNYLPQVVMCTPALWTAVNKPVASCWTIELAARTGTNEYYGCSINVKKVR